MGRPGEAVSFHDSWGTWQVPELSESHERDDCSFAHGNDGVSDWAYVLLEQSPLCRGDSMVFPSLSLLFLEPVLLETCQRRYARVRRKGFAAALIGVQVGAAVRAKAAAIARADDLHWQREVDLFGEHIGEK